MPLDVRKNLHDMLQACELIRQFVQDKSYSDYLGDAMLRSAVERQFMIVGEALKQALRLDPTLAESIADSRRIVNFRHVIVHGYSQLEHATIWGIVDDELPKLRTQIEAILKRGQ